MSARAGRASRALHARGRAVAAVGVVLIVVGFTAVACRKHVTTAQCDELLDRYATLVVTERMKDATPEQVRSEQARERAAARDDDNFKNCTSELSTDDFTCAMAAKTADAFEKCLE